MNKAQRLKTGKKLRQLRKDAHLTQDELADKAQIDVTTVARTERGDTSVTIDTASKLAKALKVSLTDILGT